MKKPVQDQQGQLALEALWAVNASGGFDETFALEQLDHPNENVRTWTVRLLGDSRKISRPLREKLIHLARTESSAVVRSQLASSCKRLPAGDALPVIRQMMLRHDDQDDPHIPLLLWWAIEDKLENNLGSIMAWLKDEELFQAPVFSQRIAPRLAQRYSFELGDRVFYDFSDDYQAVYSPWKSNYTPSISQKNLVICARLLRLAPTPEAVGRLIEGMEEGLRGRVLSSVPDVLHREITKRIASIWEEGAGELDLDDAQRVFREVGERHYSASCGNCHLASGDGMRQSLVNSRWGLGPEQNLIRITLQGKQGDELMPSFASQLDDEQVASILSYIRSQWGNRADPIDASSVGQVRSDTAGRAHPWKEEELDQLAR